MLSLELSAFVSIISVLHTHRYIRKAENQSTENYLQPPESKILKVF